jgi:hypothetical protein
MIYILQRQSDGAVRIRLRKPATVAGGPAKIVAVLPGGRLRLNDVHQALESDAAIGWFQPGPDFRKRLAHLLDIQYEVLDGRAYAVLRRPEESAAAGPCPFCAVGHLHGIGDGHRMPHCVDGVETVTAADGTLIRRESGYVVRTDPRADTN